MNNEDFKGRDVHGEHYESLKEYQKSLEQFSKLKSGYLAAKILVKMGDIYYDLKERGKAIESYNLALKLYQDEKNYSGEAITLRSIGIIWKARSDYTEARKYFSQSLKLYQKIGNLEKIKDLSELISQCYQAEGSLDSAINIHLKISELPLSPEQILLNKYEINRLKKNKNDTTPTKKHGMIILSYLVLLLVVELVTYYNPTPWTILLEAMVIICLVINSLLTNDLKLSYILQALILLPLLRIIGIIIPVTEIQPLYWLVIITIPLAVAILILMKNLQLNSHDVGINTNKPGYQLLIGLSGISLGLVEYLIITPETIITNFNFTNIIFASTFIMLTTSFIEELIFRGILQKIAENILGNFGAILFVSVLFTSFNLILNSPLNLIFIFMVSLFYGYVYQKTRSILGISISHGLCNIVLYLFLPLIL